LELTARIRIAHAHALTTTSEFEAAAALLQTALDLTSSQDEVTLHLRWMALQNLADCLSKMGDFDGAGQVLSQVDEVGGQVAVPETDLLRAQWIRARIEIRADWHAGVDTLKAVRERLIESGLLYDAALASLELAEWHAEAISGSAEDEDHTAAIRGLAAESARFFVGQDISSEALAALVLFQHVASWPAPSAIAFRKIERLFRQAALS
jgi:hypothetical protein